jgi:hypothetical protein
MTTSFCTLDQSKAERFFLVRRVRLIRPSGRHSFAQADRERVVAGTLIQEELAWGRLFS